VHKYIYIISEKKI